MFNINGEEWSIYLVSPYNPKLRRSDGTYTVGVCDDKEKTIYINGELNYTYMRKVLCHEIAHAAMFSYNVNLSYEQEELIANILATYG